MVSYVVTGAGRGLGLALVRALHARRALRFPSRSQGVGSRDEIFAVVQDMNCCDELKKLDPSVHIIPGELDKPETLQSAAVEVAKITGGSLDVFINNAALIPAGKGESTLSSYIGKDDLLIKDFDTFYKTNVIGAIAVTNAFLPLIEKGTQKKVINISSAAGDLEFIEKTGYVNAVPYGISKAALNYVNKAYSIEFGGKGYTFLAISPGVVSTRPPPATLEHKLAYQAVIDMFKAGYPDWNGVPLLPSESAELILGVVDRATSSDSGNFVSQYGNKRWL